MITIIATNELRLLGRSSFSWLAAGLLQLATGWLFLSTLEQFTHIQEQLALQQQPYGLSAYLCSQWLAPTAMIFLLVSPLLCMSLLAAERQSGRYALFATSPVSSTDLILSKYLAALCLQYLILAINLLPGFFLFGLTWLDIWQLATAALGLLLLISLSTALTLYFSTLTQKPALAGFCGFMCLILLWLMSSASTIQPSSQGAGWLSALSPATHLTPLMNGQLNSVNIIYFLAFTSMLLILSVYQLGRIARPFSKTRKPQRPQSGSHYKQSGQPA